MPRKKKRHRSLSQLPPPPPSSPSSLSSLPIPNPAVSPTRLSELSQPSPNLSFQQRRQLFIPRENGVAIRGGQKPGCAELIGGTVAGCAAVCCCCPCGVLDFLVLTMVKLPAGLYRKALRRRKMKKRQKNADTKISEDFGSDLAAGLGRMNGTTMGLTETMWSEKKSEEMVEMDKEMWAKFDQGGGFWRSVSQNDD